MHIADYRRVMEFHVTLNDVITEITDSKFFDMNKWLQKLSFKLRT